MSKDSKGSFIFYRSFRDAIDQVASPDKGIIYEAIANYALDEKEPALEGVTKAIWLLIKPQLDANRRRYKNSLKGGAPRGSRNNPHGRRGKTRTKQELTENKPNENDNENDNENEKSFQTPSIYEVENYIKSNGYSISANVFYNFYTSNGWKVGTNPMDNWRASVDSWNSRENHTTLETKAY